MRGLATGTEPGFDEFIIVTIPAMGRAERYPALLGLARKIIRATPNKKKQKKNRATREKQKNKNKKHKNTQKDGKTPRKIRAYARKKARNKLPRLRAKINHLPGLAQVSKKRRDLRPGHGPAWCSLGFFEGFFLGSGRRLPKARRARGLIVKFTIIIITIVHGCVYGG